MLERGVGLACLLVAFGTGCAREKGSETPGPPSTGPVGPVTTSGVGVVTTPPALPTSPLPEATPPSSTASSEKPKKAPTQAELFRAQDACLNACDQFACMKIAEAYRDGVGIPRDVLAGRRYAIHACLECGKPTLAIADACPAWGVTDR